jgi:DNA-directed RNA polymerase specialized sigma24 family protein
MGIPDSGGSLTRVLSTVAKTTSDSVCSEVERVVIRLFDEHRTRLLRYVLSIGLPVPDAEKIVQDVFLALFRQRRGTRKDYLHFLAVAKSIAGNRFSARGSPRLRLDHEGPA